MRSLSGFILHHLGVTVSWQLNTQPSVMLLSLEAEWVASMEAVKEVLFLIQLLGSMKISVKLPVMVRVDNVGAIFMAIYITTKSHTKCVDIRY